MITVKPLEWEDLGFWRAQTQFVSCYSVWDVGSDKWQCSLIDGYFKSAEEAKAAAQSDYESRILSAITNTLVPTRLTKKDVADLRQVLADALQSVRDHGSSSWDDWMIEKADAALSQNQSLSKESLIEAEAEVSRLKSDRLYIIGFNDGFAAAKEQSAADEARAVTQADIANALIDSGLNEKVSVLEIEALLAALTNTSGDDQAERSAYVTNEMVEAACRATVLGEDENYEPFHLEPREARIALEAAFAVSAALPQSAAVRDEEPDLLSIIKRMLDNPATMVTDFGHPERATLTITFDTHDGAWAFMHAAGDARRALRETQEG